MFDHEELKPLATGNPFLRQASRRKSVSKKRYSTKLIAKRLMGTNPRVARSSR
ncbi:MAG: hypothetical protein ACI9UQ_002099 [Candidatus Krumholzibacteriia bacterium]|jgi:hypothetical protein